MDTHFYEADAAQSAPLLSTLASEGYPTNGSASLGIPATRPGAAWFYGIAEELRNAIARGGLTPSNSSVSQLAEAMVAIVGKYGCPAGAIIPFAGTSTVPDNFLLCNGAVVSRVTYSALFDAIGTSYGAGDGSTTFGLPDFRDRVLQGASASHAAGTYVEAGLPNITGSRVMQHDCFGIEWQGALTATFIDTSVKLYQIVPTSIVGGKWIYSFDASRSNKLYGASSTVQPAAGVVQYLIKY